jgi:hypothetical protein
MFSNPPNYTHLKKKEEGICLVHDNNLKHGEAKWFINAPNYTY